MDEEQLNNQYSFARATFSQENHVYKERSIRVNGEGGRLPDRSRSSPFLCVSNTHHGVPSPEEFRLIHRNVA